MKALIPAAGDGTRAVSYTAGNAKELLTCLDRPAINFVIAELVQAGITEIVVVTSAEKKDLNRWLSGDDSRILRWQRNGKMGPVQVCQEIKDNVAITFAFQEEPLGLGHAVLQGRDAIGDSPFVVALPDDLIVPIVQDPRSPSPSAILAGLGREGFSGLLTMAVSDEETSKYGIIETRPHDDHQWPLATSLVEKPHHSETASRQAAIGRYVFQPEIFEYLAAVKPGVGGEIQLTDALDALVHDERDLQVTSVDPDHKRFDLGSQSTYQEFLAHLIGAHNAGLTYPTVAESAALQAKVLSGMDAR